MEREGTCRSAGGRARGLRPPNRRRPAGRTRHHGDRRLASSFRRVHGSDGERPHGRSPHRRGRASRTPSAAQRAQAAPPPSDPRERRHRRGGGGVRAARHRHGARQRRREPSLAGTIHAGGAQVAPATVTTTVDGKRCRTLSTTDPLRLWVGGDSLAGSLGPSLGDDHRRHRRRAALLRLAGVERPRRSGLLRLARPRHQRDGPARSRDRRLHHRRQRLDAPSSGERVEGRLRATRSTTMMKTLDRSRARTVFWIGVADRSKDQKLDAAAVEVERDRAGRRQAPPRGARTSTPTRCSPDADGKYAATCPTRPARSSRMRAGDGVHFTDGRRRLPGPRGVQARRRAVRGDRAGGRRA